MLDKILAWLRKYNVEITWFLMGFLFLAGIESFKNGDTVAGLIQWGLVVVNYLLRPRR
jgi:hypothetical protein